MAVSRGDAIDFDCGTIPMPRVTKNTAGYLLRPGMDWVDLFVGSDGTLALVTEARLRLLPLPAAVLGAVVFFPSDEAALDAVESWRTTASGSFLPRRPASKRDRQTSFVFIYSDFTLPKSGVASDGSGPVIYVK